MKKKNLRRLKHFFFATLIIILPFTLLWASLFAWHKNRIRKFNKKVIEAVK